MNVVYCELSKEFVEKVLSTKEFNTVEYPIEVLEYGVLTVTDTFRKYFNNDTNKGKLIHTNNLFNRVNLKNFSEDMYSHTSMSWELIFYREGILTENVEQEKEILINEITDYLKELSLKEINVLECKYNGYLFTQGETKVIVPNTVTTFHVNNVYDVYNNDIDFVLTDLQNIDIEKEIDKKLTIYKNFINNNVEEDKKHILKSIFKRVNKK